MIKREVEPGSLEWFELRSQHITASEAAGLCGVSPWFPNSPRQVFEVKLGKKTVRQNFAMKRGQDLEPLGLALANEKLGTQAKPAVYTRGRYLASLDGYDPISRTIIEVKCPMGPIPDEIPVHYMYQLAMQYYCQPNATEVYLAYYKPDQDIVLIGADLRKLEQIADTVLEVSAPLIPFLLNRELPPLMKGEMEVRTDDAWTSAADEYKAAKAEFRLAEENLKRAEETLKSLAPDGAAEGAGVKLIRVERSGSIKYSAIVSEFPERFEGIDLEKYRGETVVSYRFTVEDEK